VDLKRRRLGQASFWTEWVFQPLPKREEPCTPRPHRIHERCNRAFYVRPSEGRKGRPGFPAPCIAKDVRTDVTIAKAMFVLTASCA
jgi:hypothetical protein